MSERESERVSVSEREEQKMGGTANYISPYIQLKVNFLIVQDMGRKEW